MVILTLFLKNLTKALIPFIIYILFHIACKDIQNKVCNATKGHKKYPKIEYFGLR